MTRLKTFLTRLKNPGRAGAVVDEEPLPKTEAPDSAKPAGGGTTRIGGKEDGGGVVSPSVP